MNIDISFIFKIWKWIKSLFKSKKAEEDFRQEITEDTPKGELVGYVPHGCDYEKVLATIKTWEDVKVFRQACKDWGVKEGKGGQKWGNGNLTERCIQEYMLGCSYCLDNENEEEFRKYLQCRIEDCTEIIELVKKDRVKEWENAGILCPSCKDSKTNYYTTGLVEIKYDYVAGGPIGGGIHISGTGTKEFQFHYRKCPKCGYWYMVEYRETPSWWDDLWNNDCPFKQGDIIQQYKSREKDSSSEKFKSYEITRW